jgi:hypothetical protein
MPYYLDDKCESSVLVSETICGTDIYFDPTFNTYYCDIWNSKTSKTEEIEGYSFSDVKERLTEIMLQNFYNTLVVLSDNIGETKKDFNDPVEHYGNVITAIQNKIDDCFN